MVQIVSAQPGLITQMSGFLTSRRIWGAPRSVTTSLILERKAQEAPALQSGSHDVVLVSTQGTPHFTLEMRRSYST